jgi:hypothetical protein
MSEKEKKSFTTLTPEAGIVSATQHPAGQAGLVTMP